MRARTAVLILAAASAAMAQENAPSGFLRGNLLSWNGTTRKGQFTFRSAKGSVYACSYDDKTYFERDSQSATLAGTREGDQLELVADRRLGSSLCYARSVHIVDARPAASAPGARPRLRTAATFATAFPLRPAFSLSGAVYGLTSDSLILRTRSGEHDVIRLRPDTRYMMEGQTADRNSLSVNTIVFIRGGRNVYDEVEAYQVIWGEILQPEP